VELVVLDLDGGDMLVRLLAALERQAMLPARVVIVDNGSAEPVAGRLPQQPFPVELIRLETNRGFTGGVNAAFGRLRSRYIGLLNNDAEPEPEWIERLAGVLDRQPQIAAVQSVIVDDGGRIDGAGIGIDSGRYLQLGHGEPVGVVLPRPWGVSATAAIYRLEALREVALADGSLFDDRLFAYYEDVELSARLRSAGWEVQCIPEPLVVHRGSATAPRLGWRGEYLRVRNRYLVAALHPGVGSRAAMVGEDLRRFVRAAAHGEARRAVMILRGAVAGLAGGIGIRARAR
jgi:GT2 family glycosyltransferase